MIPACLAQEDIRLPTRTDGTGKLTGGGLISRRHLYKILSNPIYAGRLTHKGRVHDGLHAPIVDNRTWGQVQSLLAEHAQHKNARRQVSDALLAGKLFDDRGNRVSPSHATKRGRRWRYYVSQAVLEAASKMPGPSLASRRWRSNEGSAKRFEPSCPFLIVSVRWNCEANARVELAAPTAFPAALTAARSGATELAANLRATVERVMITRTTIEIELGDGIAGDDQDRILIVPWTPQSPYRRREICGRWDTKRARFSSTRFATPIVGWAN